MSNIQVVVVKYQQLNISMENLFVPFLMFGSHISMIKNTNKYNNADDHDNYKEVHLR